MLTLNSFEIHTLNWYYLKPRLNNPFSCLKTNIIPMEAQCSTSEEMVLAFNFYTKNFIEVLIGYQIKRLMYMLLKRLKSLIRFLNWDKPLLKLAKWLSLTPLFLLKIIVLRRFSLHD